MAESESMDQGTIWYSLNILKDLLIIIHIVFREFRRHVKLLQPLEFDYLAKFTKRPVRNDLFSQWKEIKLKNFKKIKVVKM